MAYRNQNYMTNRKIKAAVDKNQKGYVDPDLEQEEEIPVVNFTYGVILSEADYDNELSNPNSGLSKYYNKYPREDGVDAQGNPVRDPDTEVVEHSWESAITAPTDPAQTSSFPWISISMNDFIGDIEVKYDGETKFTRTWENPKQFAILSVPNDLQLTDYRLEWGTGNIGEEEFNKDLLTITLTPKTE